MFESFFLRDFQRWEKLSVPLDPHVTVFVGPTESGKSSALRGLRWFCLNQPRGGDLTRWGQSGVDVRLTFDGGRRASRRRRGRDNSYRLGGAVQRAPKAGVPTPIADLLNVGEDNFQGQLDPPFWFQLPAPEVSRQLNRIVNLSVIDAALAAAAKEVRERAATAAVCRSRLVAARARRNSLAWAVAFDRKVKAVEDLRQKWRDLVSKCENLGLFIAQATEAKKRQRTLAQLKLDAGGAIKRGLAARRLADRAARLGTLLDDLDRARQAAAGPKADPAALQRLYDTYRRRAERARELGSIILGISELRYQRWHALAEEKAARKRLQEKSRGRCPVCGQRLPPHSHS